MPRFSANLGLWKELPLPEAVRAARSGLRCSRVHEPYHYPAEEIREALEESQLEDARSEYPPRHSCLKTRALPPFLEEADARNIIDEAIEYAASINCQNIHVIAGITGKIKEAEETFRENLRYATQKLQITDNHPHRTTEPARHSGYHLSDWTTP